MTYDFPSDIQERIQSQIAVGAFQNEDEVLREAIDTLERRQRGLKQLREMVGEADVDIQAGRIAPFDADQTKAVVREQLREQGIVE